MDLLLDTHAFLFLVSADARLGKTAMSLIADPTNNRFLSVASLWEMAIKYSLGKLKLSKSFDVFISEHLNLNRITLLDVSASHVMGVATLAFHHRDPFDRLLVVQSNLNKITLLSADDTLDAYGIDRRW